MFLTDALGSLVATTDAAGGVQSELTYEPFGNTEMSAPAPAYRFTGREHDEPLYLYYYRARYYQTDLQRFIGEDPIGFAGGDINLYGYVRNNPSMFIDASGNLAMAAVIGASVGFFSGFYGAQAQGGTLTQSLVAGLIGGVGGGLIGAIDPTEVGTALLVGGLIGGLANGVGQATVQTMNTHDLYCIFKDFNFGSFAGSVVGGALGAGFGTFLQAGLLSAAESAGISSVATNLAIRLPTALAAIMPELALERLGANLPIPNGGKVMAPVCKKQ